MVKTASSGGLLETGKKRPFWATESIQGMTHEEFEAKLQVILDISAREMNTTAEPKEATEQESSKLEFRPADIHFHASG